MRIGTKAIHAGSAPDRTTGAIVPPITLSTTFERGNSDIYSRTSNPNRAELEETVAALEEADHGIAYASGMAAITSVIGLVKSGERILSIAALYGGTYLYLNQIATTLGIQVDYADDLHDITALVKDDTRLVWLESPTNPTMQVTDIAALANQCRARGILLAVDNTFASPILVRPLTLGADIVVHSATKYLNGHADVTMGVTCTNHHDVAETLRSRRNLTGAVPSPFDCWLCQRGIKTLALRVRHASASALLLAQFLQGHKSVTAVSYPALKASPFHALTQRQSHGMGGGMLSFRVAAGVSVEKLCAATKLFKWAVSLGGVESLIEIPASALTHRALGQEVREKIGIYDDLIRISVGCEDVEDLLDDLKQALAAAAHP